ncbi:DUF4394 domain-containing protein [Nibrella saemangeumensis]|uniref:DUF4394 domain-containing protein n=1 Tax=Nibrella saemangeumensis TaxID=1084526 RepID=A0ABP8NDX4_9BACT
MKGIVNPLKAVAFALLLTTLAACQNDALVPSKPEVLSTANARKGFGDITFYALAGGIQLDKYSTKNPEMLLQSVTISGLQMGETILGIDFRPATGQLYGLGSTSRLYTINTETGMATMVGPGPFTPSLMGNVAGFDFNPTVDRIRIVTDQGQNLRVNPITGAVAVVDGMINGQAGARISAVAYTNNMAGATTTTLYNIDVASQKLFKQMPPNDGTLVEVGSLGLKVVGEGGFDISSSGGVALALYEVNKKSTLFTIDLETGKATTLAKYNKSLMYTGIAIPTM